MVSDSGVDNGGLETTDSSIGISNQVILASAGTGKTQSLSARYLQLVHKNQPPERILATTFTRKAAGEIFERILQRLADSVHDEEKRDFLSEQLGEPITVGRCQELLIRLTRNLHQIRVGTLDSFFQQIATSLAPELGLPPAWEIADEVDDRRIRSEALRRVLEKNPVREVTELMHMLAKGDATRKTTDFLMNTINGLYSFYRDSEQEGDKAWKTKSLPTVLDEKQLATAIETFSNLDIPEKKAWLSAHEKSTDQALTADWKPFLTKGIGVKVATGEPKFSSGEIPPDVVAGYQPLVQHAVGLLLLQESNKVKAARELIKKFAAEYEQLKLDRESIGFDDIPVRLAKMSRGNHKRLAYRLDSQLDHLLLDEFQDTSGTQWRAIRPFAEKVTGDPAAGGTFFCVGDVKQAIYGWRGGQAEILQSIETQLSNVTGKNLVKTFRCSAPVVEAVNQVFAGVTRHPNLGDYEEGITSWCDEFKDHEAAGDHVGYATLLTSDFDEDDQAAATFRSIAKLVKKLSRELGPNRSIGVLVQKNSTVRDLISYLRECDVWASQEGASPLTDSAAIQQILSACRFADSPGDSVSRYHLQQGLFQGLFESEADAIDTKRGNEIATEFRRRLVEDGYGVVVQEWADALRPMCSERELHRLRQLVEMAYVYQARLSDSRSALRPIQFVEFVETEGVSNSTSADVRVMVTHQSKGLEFDAVVVGELDRLLSGQTPTFVVRRSDTQFWPEHIFTYTSKALRGLLPQEIRKTQERDTTVRCRELMCGLYVAMTRARYALYMVVAPDHPDKKTTFPKKVSGLLRVALKGQDKAEPNETLFETGDADWFSRGKQTANTDENDDSTKVTKQAPAKGSDTAAVEEVAKAAGIAKRIQLKQRGEGAGRGQEALSPSQRSAGAAVSGSEWFAKDRLHAMEHGSLIHAWLEQVEWLERDLFGTGMPDDGDLRKIAIQLPVRWVNVDDAIQKFHRMLKEPRICNLFRQEPYRKEFSRWFQSQVAKELPASARFEVFNEQPIVFSDGGRCGTGTIDRLVLVYDGDEVIAADVIDHKTDRAKSDNDAQKRVEFYGPQLRKYRDAVSEMFGLDSKRIRMRLALVGGGRIAEVV